MNVLSQLDGNSWLENLGFCPKSVKFTKEIVSLQKLMLAKIERALVLDHKIFKRKNASLRVNASYLFKQKI